jgi:glycosyltransferase involved in cell wall biosynthesis
VNALSTTERGPSVVFVIRSFGFPRGMAATNRVLLMGRALLREGADASVLCARVTERPGAVLNTLTHGERDGIPFTYTAGATVRSDRFIVRRYREARGLVVAVLELRRRRREHRLDCVYLPEVAKAQTPRPRAGARRTASDIASQLPSLWSLRGALWLMGVPMVVEVNELPATIDRLPSVVARRLSHLQWATAATPISDWLRMWVANESSRIGKRLDTVVIPILVDVDEQPVTPYPQQGAMFVYSASAYYDSLAFVFQAMSHAWQRRPECRITVTGIEPGMTAEIARREGLAEALTDGRIVAAGHLPRESLLEAYRDASALLVPLHDDLESRARFPTKLGEYLAAARPVVTNAVGEIPRFLSHDRTAYLSAPGDVAGFAACLLDVLDDREKAARIGLAGRGLAEALFDFRLHGATLISLIERTSRDRQPWKRRR